VPPCRWRDAARMACGPLPSVAPALARAQHSITALQNPLRKTRRIWMLFSGYGFCKSSPDAPASPGAGHSCCHNLECGESFMSTQPSRARPGNGRILATAIAAALAAGYAAPASAVPIQPITGPAAGTPRCPTARCGASEPDCRLIANANGGCGRSANIDDGNLNFAPGSSPAPSRRPRSSSSVSRLLGPVPARHRVSMTGRRPIPSAPSCPSPGP
jgi:hypothetical protein